MYFLLFDALLLFVNLGTVCKTHRPVETLHHCWNNFNFIQYETAIPVNLLGRYR